MSILAVNFVTRRLRFKVPHTKSLLAPKQGGIRRLYSSKRFASFDKALSGSCRREEIVNLLVLQDLANLGSSGV